MVAVARILRENTRVAHEALERTPLARDLMSPHLTTLRYVEILSIWAATWNALETCIWTSPVAHEFSDLLPPRCVHLAHEDLLYWRQQGYVIDDQFGRVSHDWAALRPTQVAALAGVCYVARGASLGSKVIAVHLEKTLHLSPGCGMSFFAPGAPEDTSPVTWPQWAARLDAQLDSPEAVALAVVWANAAFAALHDSFVNADHAQPVAV